MHYLEEYCSQNPPLSLCAAFGFLLAGSFWQQCHSQHWPHQGPQQDFVKGKFVFVGLTLIMKKEPDVFKL